MTRVWPGGRDVDVLLPKGQSSPGILQSGQQPSNAIRQIPQLSSLATQRHVATPIHSDIEQHRVAIMKKRDSN